MAASQWERLLEMGTPNEIRCALLELGHPGDELHWRLMEALEAMFERGAVYGKAQREADPPGLLQ
jgi:hypothetical protein